MLMTPYLLNEGPTVFHTKVQNLLFTIVFQGILPKCLT